MSNLALWICLLPCQAELERMHPLELRGSVLMDRGRPMGLAVTGGMRRDHRRRQRRWKCGLFTLMPTLLCGSKVLICGTQAGMGMVAWVGVVGTHVNKAYSLNECP